MWFIPAVRKMPQRFRRSTRRLGGGRVRLECSGRFAAAPLLTDIDRSDHKRCKLAASIRDSAQGS
jgi:hypothetical protein